MSQRSKSSEGDGKADSPSPVPGQPRTHLPKRRFWLSTRDIVAIAMLAALGGVLSAYVGYLGNMVNHAVGVPYGAGQFMAGLHVFWIILALSLTRRRGAATMAGLLKGTVEFLAGSTHGVVIIFASLVQGLVVDAVMLAFPARWWRLGSMLSAGLSAMTFILFFQLLYLGDVPLVYVSIMYALAFCSGIIFGGWLGEQAADSVRAWGVMRWTGEDGDAGERPQKAGLRNWLTPSKVIAGLLALSFLTGGAYYFAFVYRLPGSEPSCDVGGAVSHPFTYEPGDFADEEATVFEALDGTVTHLPARNYTGIPLRVLLENAHPYNSSNTVEVYGSDGYMARFDIDDVMGSDRIILVEEDGRLRLVAGGYEGAYWVEDVVEVSVS